ncbi:hypothetical protein Oscil6304_4101 [Oscillatoria acuminata PCC 6304]|uniref:Uncharacterized protein n=1 Tax=Oscillatoria acuminata PCC 6304 TaxID=56110 RepID=K9TM65_9CYAN|nr:hypothetical protein Oscil6304_4101 [Oscillatoria acuminata PCC 6304]
MGVKNRGEEAIAFSPLCFFYPPQRQAWRLTGRSPPARAKRVPQILRTPANVERPFWCKVEAIAVRIERASGASVEAGVQNLVG